KTSTMQRRISTETGPINTDAGGINFLFMNQPTDSIGNVVLYLPAPFFGACRPELLSITNGSSVVDLKYGIATISEKLHFRIKIPSVAIARTAMRVYNHRRFLTPCVGGHGQIAVYWTAITCIVGNG